MPEENNITRGERGPRGDHGQEGHIGATGEQGVQGEIGVQGEAGPEGPGSIFARNISISFLALAVVATIILGVMGWSIIKNRDLAQDLKDVALTNCQTIEALKASEREAALLSFRRLDVTLRVLGVEKTPEVLETAIQNRDEKLERFKARDCRVPPPE